MSKGVFKNHNNKPSISDNFKNIYHNTDWNFYQFLKKISKFLCLANPRIFFTMHHLILFSNR